MHYAQVIVDVPNLNARTFSYLIPEELKDLVQIGIPVLVPFGSLGVVNAYVTGFSNYLPEGIKAKSIYEVLDEKPVFDLEYLKFLEWVSNYYICDLPTVINAAVPVNFFSKAKRVAVLKENNTNDLKLSKDEQVIFSALKEKNEAVIGTLQKKSKLAPSKFYEAIRKLRNKDIIGIKNVTEEEKVREKTEKFIHLLNKETENKRYKEILQTLENLGGKAKFSEFLKAAKTTPDTVKKLAGSANLEIREENVFRNPLMIFEIDSREDFLKLSEEQEKAYKRIIEAAKDKDSQPFLLYGVTGSGKTEVYFHAAKNVIEEGKNVIFLTPEIALASQLAYRTAKRFGTEKVAIWHSALSEGEKFDIWQRIRNNEVKIIVGARSGIFAPIKNIGLIVVDEEHESSYKQTSPAPRYNAKELAVERAKRENAAVVLGTATPDITTYYKASNSDRVLKLPERFGNADLAKTLVIDMKTEYPKGRRSIFSTALHNAIEKNLQEKKQSIILINRRGFSTYTFCALCGYVAECQKCSIPLILHKSGNRLRCHYCGFERDIITLCPNCSGKAMVSQGLGTQRVEEEFRKEFPNAVCARLDSDIMTKKNAHIQILRDFEKGLIDVLIGTQMVAKGLDIPNVTLVGVLTADTLFNFPDFRSSERGFQLLTQVAGRAGRGDFKGKVYFQTFSPDYFAITSAKEQDYLTFYASEIQERSRFEYPPFSSIIRFIVSSKNEIRASKFADEIAYKLNLLVDSRGIKEKLEVLGPAPCIISKIKNEFRFQIIIKNRMEEKGHLIISAFISKFKIPEDIRFLVDVDPADML